jgi:hypothetical protein
LDGINLLKSDLSFNHPTNGGAEDASIPKTFDVNWLEKSKVYAVSGDVKFLLGSASNIEIRIYGASTSDTDHIATAHLPIVNGHFSGKITVLDKGKEPKKFIIYPGDTTKKNSAGTTVGVTGN